MGRSSGRATVLLAWAVVGMAAVMVLAGCGSQGTEPASNEARYEDPDFAPDVDLDGDVPQVTLGGYVFDATSHRLTHPQVNLRETSPGWVFRGWGTETRRTMVIDVSYGGRVQDVKTLRLRRVGVGTQGDYEDELLWMAQDMTGNVHFLKQRILASSGGARAAERLGVASGDPAWFLLPVSPTVGQTWYHEGGIDAPKRFDVLSDTATFHRHTGLLRVRRIEDASGDGRYSSAWDGPDNREDWYFETDTGLLNMTLHSAPAGGLERF